MLFTNALVKIECDWKVSHHVDSGSAENVSTGSRWLIHSKETRINLPELILAAMVLMLAD